MTEAPRAPRWVLRAVVDAIHADQVRQHGGALGIRDEGLLESALARARNRLAHEPGSDVSTLAAAYAYGLSSNQPFMDGNKRIAFQVMYVFLGLNGYRLRATEPEVVRVMMDLAAGHLEEEVLASWVQAHLEQR